MDWLILYRFKKPSIQGQTNPRFNFLKAKNWKALCMILMYSYLAITFASIQHKAMGLAHGNGLNFFVANHGSVLLLTDSNPSFQRRIIHIYKSTNS